jgi:hypothetical protein
VKDKEMISDIAHVAASVNRHIRVKLNACVSSRFSVATLKEYGYNITKRQALYSKSPEKKEIIISEGKVCGGGRPPHSEENIDTAVNYITDITTESRELIKKSFFIKKNFFQF